MTGAVLEKGPSAAPAAGGLAAPQDVLVSTLSFPESVDGYLASSTTYGPLKAGDRCRVISGFWKDRLKGCRLEFIRYEVNLITGHSCLVFWGGKSGYATWQYIGPTHVQKI